MDELRFAITAFKNRRVPIGARLDLTWEEIVERFRNPEITEESMSEYCGMTNEQKTEIKDVGGYVAGELKGNRRSKAALVHRQIITIDVDHADSEEQMAELHDRYHLRAHLIHSTHSSTPESPRFRMLIPLTRPVNSAEYRYLANWVAKDIGLGAVDDTTDQPERLMFWPSVAFDGEYVFYAGGERILDPDKYLPEELPEEPAAKAEKPIENGVLEIGEGQRNKTVFGFAATLRGNGLDQAGIRAILDEYNERYCNPPLDPFELDTITRSVCTRYAPGEAVASSLRDAWDDFNDMGEWKEETEKKVEKGAPIQGMTGSELGAIVFPPRKYVVEKLISTGATLIAGPPKYGKSWMCLDLALSVATGEDFLGFKTNKCKVLYIDNEDDSQAMQERAVKVVGSRKLPENFLTYYGSPTMREGLIDSLEATVRADPDIGLVIVDTFQTVRDADKKSGDAYQMDSNAIKPFHRFALDHKLALVLVHHTNKYGDNSDPLTRINGSMGFGASVATNIVLSRDKRKDEETIMSVVTRRNEDRTLVLRMDWNRYKWIVLGEEQDLAKVREDSEYNNNPIVKTVKLHLDEAEEMIDDPDIREAEWKVSSSALLEEMERLYGKQDVTAQGIGRRIGALEARMLLDGICHEYSTGHGKARLHTFTREII